MLFARSCSRFVRPGLYALRSMFFLKRTAFVSLAAQRLCNLHAHVTTLSHQSTPWAQRQPTRNRPYSHTARICVIGDVGDADIFLALEVGSVDCTVCSNSFVCFSRVLRRSDCRGGGSTCIRLPLAREASPDEPRCLGTKGRCRL